MAPPPFKAEPGHWFLRGVQSAIFYYISFTPCLEVQHKRKRRKEAKAQAQAETEVITTQPGIVRQPGPFQTNETWAEELMLGPGPPKGWKGDKLLMKLQKDSRKSETADAAPNSPELPQLHPELTSTSLRLSTQPTESSSRPSSSDTETVATEEPEHEPSKTDTPAAGHARPLLERRLSNAMENIKDSFRTTLHPEMWNWKRYEREDEVLKGFSERMTRIWNRATSGTHNEDPEEQHEAEGSSSRRKRAPTNESDRYDYRRARHPEINDLHPPIVSQLPATRDEAAWMMLPPPSAAVMAGKRRPGAEAEMRWPLCVMGRPSPHPDPSPKLAMTLSSQQIGNEEARVSDVESLESGEDDLISKSDESIKTPSPVRVKHLSDPIIKPPPIYTRPSLSGDLVVPKRRDSWQFHYLVPPNQATG